MGLFSDIYNTVAKFFRPQEEQGDASKSVATNRLKLVLMQDRTNLTPKILEQMRGELIDLLSRYVELDKELLELNFEQEGEQVALMLSIPVIRAKDEEEIEAALRERDEVNESDNCEEESQEGSESVEESIDGNDESGEQVEDRDDSCVIDSCDEQSDNVDGASSVSKPSKRSSKKKEEVKEECHSEV